jgi:hypothetical protein
VSDVVWARGLLRKGVGLCHGISGNACLFLYLFRATRSAKYLHRAWAFARFSLSDECARETWNKPDEVRRLALSACVSDPKLTSTWRLVPHTQPYCLFNGLAGSAWFCADLLRVAKAVVARAEAQLDEALSAFFFPACDLA